MDNQSPNHENYGFRYTYSAKEQAEIKKIREKYAPMEPAGEKMERLRRLDAGVTRKARAVALTLGVLGTLILGLGMSFCMTALGQILGDSENMAMAVGIPVGLAGCVLVCLAYPVFNLIVKRERRRVAPEILRLTDELMK